MSQSGRISADAHLLNEVVAYPIGHEIPHRRSNIGGRSFDHSVEPLGRRPDCIVEVESPTRFGDDLDRRLRGAAQPEGVLRTGGNFTDSEKPGNGVDPIGDTEPHSLPALHQLFWLTKAGAAWKEENL